MTTKLGCFGSILFRDRNPSGRCDSCALSVDCQNHIDQVRSQIYERASELAPLSTKRGQKIKEFIDDALSAPKVEDKAGVVEQKTQVTRNDLNKKPMEFYLKWVEQNINFASILNGENPFFASRSTFAKVCTDWLIQTRFPTKSALRAHLQKCLNWSFGTANSHANIYCEVMEYVGVLLVDNNQIHFKGKK